MQNQLLAVLLYNIFLRFYGLGISVASLFNQKASLWKQGRKDIFPKLKECIGQNESPVWMHCASLGEFEQGRPILESLRKDYPGRKILLTFFSPSGYEIRKNYSGADWVFYLPLDTPKNVEKFLNTVRPSLAIFVKYEYWFNFLKQLNSRNIPTILISAIFRKDKIFFKWYGNLHRKMLGYFEHVFVQDKESEQLLSTILPQAKYSIAGDTRFDRVAEISSAFQPIPEVEKFVGNKAVLVAGSTWPDDEKMLKQILEKFNDKILLIIAPHQITQEHINFLLRLFPDSWLFSNINKSTEGGLDKNYINTLIINNIGMLSKLYFYSDICYVGGGFNSSGIHNTLEAAVYGKPVIFGPNFHKFGEAVALTKNGGAISFSNENELNETIERLLSDQGALAKMGDAAGKYVRENTGATNIIMNWLRQISF